MNHVPQFTFSRNWRFPFRPVLLHTGQNPPKKGGGSNKGALIAIIVVCILAFLAVVAIVLFFYRNKQKKTDNVDFAELREDVEDSED